MIPGVSLIELLEREYAPRRLGLAPATVANYLRAISSLERYWQRQITVAELDEDLVLPWLQQRLKQVAPKTVHRERGDLLTLWRFAHRRKLCGTYPHDVARIKVPLRNPTSWTRDEYEQLVCQCRTLKGEVRGTGIPNAAWWSSLMVFFYWVGSRLSATLAIRAGDVDLRRRVVLLQPEYAKTGRAQVISLHDEVIVALAGIHDQRRELVWPFPYHRRQLWVKLKKILTAANLPSDRYRMFACCRRTTYTLATIHGSAEIAARQLGHSTDMSRHYLDQTQVPQVQAADVLPRLQ